VYAASSSTYGDHPALPKVEDKIGAPISPYGVTKLVNELYAKVFAELYDMEFIGLRYFNVYGPRQDPASPYSGVISKFIDNYKKQEPIIIFGDGKQSRDFIFVSDVARANLSALENDYVGILNIATGIPETLHNLIDYIEQQGSTQSQKFYMDARVGDIKESYANPSKAKEYLNFEFKVPLANGIQQLMKT